MANILFGNGWADARGSLNGVTYARNRSGAYARNRTKPVNPNTVLQSQNRARFAMQVALWTSLTAAQQSGWEALALGATRLNKLGQPYTPTGRQLFLESANNMQLAGLAVISNAPISANIPDPTEYVGVTIVSSAGPPAAVTSVTLDGGSATGNELMIKATPYNPGPKTNFSNLYRFIGHTVTTPDNDIVSFVTDFFGTVPGATGSPFSVLVSQLDTATGFRSAEQRLDGVFPTPGP